MISLQPDLKNQSKTLTLLADTNLNVTSLPTYHSYLNVFFRWAEISGEREFLQISDSDLQVLMDMYVKHLRKRVDANEISPNTVPKQFKPMKLLLEVNYRENAVGWKPIAAQYPPKEKLSGYKPWETDQIDTMLDFCKNLREMAVIHFHSSGGCRVGVHDHPLLMKHVTKMEGPGGEKCYAVLIYAEADETITEKDTRNNLGQIDSSDYSHFIFMTPEATIAIDNYLNYRQKKLGETFTSDTPLFRSLRVNEEGNHYQMTGNGFQKTIQRILKRTPILRTKKRNRYDTQIDHGFRKRFNTILKLKSEVNSNIAEKLMQHKKGLDGTYLVPTRHECFREFAKAIPELTVNRAERQRMEIEKKQQRITDLEVANSELMQMRKTDDMRWEKIIRRLEGDGSCGISRL